MAYTSTETTTMYEPRSIDRLGANSQRCRKLSKRLAERELISSDVLSEIYGKSGRDETSAVLDAARAKFRHDPNAFKELVRALKQEPILSSLADEMQQEVDYRGSKEKDHASPSVIREKESSDTWEYVKMHSKRQNQEPTSTLQPRTDKADKQRSSNGNQGLQQQDEPLQDTTINRTCIIFGVVIVVMVAIVAVIPGQHNNSSVEFRRKWDFAVLPNQSVLLDVSPYNTAVIYCYMGVESGAKITHANIQWTESTTKARLPSSTGYFFATVTENIGNTTTVISRTTVSFNAIRPEKTLLYNFTCSGTVTIKNSLNATESLTSIDHTLLRVKGPRLPSLPKIGEVTPSSHSVIIRWTVSSVAYTPETYMVHFGIDSTTLNLSSDPVTDVNMDFHNINDQDYFVVIDGLKPAQKYYYFVNSTNSYGSSKTKKSAFITTDSKFLPGMVESGETVLKVVGDREQNLSWEGYGFYVTVPEGAVPEDVTVYLRVKAILSGQFKLPNNSHLVSAIYWVSSSHIFEKEVSVHLSHYANIRSEEEASNYKFIVGKSFQKNLPYTFDPRNGVFSPHSQIGTISLKEFSIIGIINIFDSKKTDYKYMLHYCLTEVEPYMEWMANFFVTHHLPEKLQGVEKVCPCPWIREVHLVLEFEEGKNQLENQNQTSGSETGANEDQSVNVQISCVTDGKKENWKLFYQTPTEILRRHVDDYQRDMDSTLTSSNMLILWKGEEDQQRRDHLECNVNFIGAKPPQNHMGVFFSRSSSTSSKCTRISSEEPNSTETSRKGTAAEQKSSDCNRGPPQTNPNLITPFRELYHFIVLIGYYKDDDPVFAALIGIAFMCTASMVTKCCIACCEGKRSRKPRAPGAKARPTRSSVIID